MVTMIEMGFQRVLTEPLVFAVAALFDQPVNRDEGTDTVLSVCPVDFVTFRDRARPARPAFLGSFWTCGELGQTHEHHQWSGTGN
jgi:hypothetical protein